MSTINWGAVSVIASLAVVYGFGRDILKSILDKRKAVLKSEQDQIMAPLKAHGIVLEDATQSFTLQSALLLQGRVDLQDERKRRIEAESELDILKDRLKAAEQKNTDLLLQIGRLYGQQQPGREGA